jgi:hypothetical protein
MVEEKRDAGEEYPIKFLAESLSQQTNDMLDIFPKCFKYWQQ